MQSPTIISRSQWGAKKSLGQQSLSVNPPTFVVIHHSDGPPCYTEDSCKRRVANIQAYHMNDKQWKDIGYNFLVGGDGNVYEGRGWGAHGAHCPDYNAKSIGICLIGNFMTNKPSDKQLDAVKSLIQYGVSQGKINKNYHLIGDRQGKSTDCPGDALFNEIKSWVSFDSSIRPVKK